MVTSRVRLFNDSVDSDKIASGTIITVDVADNAITNAKLATSAVSTNRLVGTAVTTAKIGAGAVTNAKLATSAVSTTQLIKNGTNVSITPKLRWFGWRYDLKPLRERPEKFTAISIGGLAK